MPQCGAAHVSAMFHTVRVATGQRPSPGCIAVSTAMLSSKGVSSVTAVAAQQQLPVCLLRTHPPGMCWFICCAASLHLPPNTDTQLPHSACADRDLPVSAVLLPAQTATLKRCSSSGTSRRQHAMSVSSTIVCNSCKYICLNLATGHPGSGRDNTKGSS